MPNSEDDRRDGRQDLAGAEDTGRGEYDGGCDGDDPADLFAELRRKQREYDDYCCFELDKRLEAEIRKGSIE